MSQSIIHERNSIGQHRLIVLRDGVPASSPWIASHEFGLFKGMFFHIGALGEAVPGVFKVSAVTHEDLA